MYVCMGVCIHALSWLPHFIHIIIYLFILLLLLLFFFFLLSRLLANPKATLESMVRGKVVSLPGHIQAIYVHNMLKLYAHIIATAEDEDDTEMIEEVGLTYFLHYLQIYSGASS